MEEMKAQPASPGDQLFYAAFTASPIGIALEDAEGRPLFVNPALCSMLGFREEEMCGKHFSDFSPPEDAEKDWALFEQLRAGLIDQYQLEKLFFRKDGSLIWGRLSVSSLNRQASRLVVAIVEDITEKRAAQEKLQQSETSLQKLAGHLIQAQEEEGRRIARELHDDINQQLGLLQIDLERLEQHLPDSADQTRKKLHEQCEHVSEISSDVRAILHRLHPSKLQYLGIEVSANNFCRDLSARHRVKIDFHSENIPQDLPIDISFCLFRVLQEAIQNATKHSGSPHFQVLLSGGSNEIQLTVHDSGKGFDLEDAMKGTGLGLSIMKERLRLVNGDLYVDSQQLRGTTIRARVPLNQTR